MKSLNTFILGLFIGSIVASPVLLADDTDIFIGTNVTKGDSNILMALDTSGSMRAHSTNYEAVTLGETSESLPDHPKYDPNKIYDDRTTMSVDSSGCFDDLIYRARTNFNSPTIPYVAYVANTYNFLNNSGGPAHVCRRDDNAANGGEPAGLYTPAGNLYSTATSLTNITSTAFSGCPDAVKSLLTRGYFINTNDVCGPLFNNSGYYTGRFLDFIRSLTNNSGYPIDATGTQIPWNQFFVANRLQVVKDVVNDIIANDEELAINLGLMRFNGSSGGYILQAIKPLTDVNGNDNLINQANLSARLNALSASGSTPLEENYYESSLYMRGLEEDYGVAGNYDTTAFETATRYRSPITHVCQKNSVILLTDGDPTGDTGAEDNLLALWDANRANLDATGDSIADGNCSIDGTNNGACMDELAQFMDETDLVSDIGLIGPDGTVVTTDLGVKQTATTHTIGFNNSNILLSRTAKAGNGINATATNSDEVKAFFRNAILSVLQDASNFTAPSLSVNNFNRLTNLNDLYFTLFEPSTNPLWKGNIKKYKLVDGQIVDKEGLPAVDNASGKFIDSSRSYWTDPTVEDGNEVTAGGFANRLITTRNIFSNLTGTGALATSGNELNLANLSAADFSASATAADAQNYIDWLNGLVDDGTGTFVSSRTIGDTLHTTPQVVSYNRTGGTLTDQADVEQGLFFGTNSGYIHGINVNATDATPNMEHFAFFPENLLSRVPEFYANQPNSGGFRKVYGVDGPVTFWIENDNGNGIVDTHLSETAHLYVTMRRGGNSIYALDITDFANPKLEWVIDNSDSDFAELGQTWSKVSPAKINYGSGTKNVLIFGGGYDPAHDSVSKRTPNSSGRAIYIVEADGVNAGDLLWKADAGSFPDMQYSIPTDLSILDINSDGIADRLYFGDVGGQLWRFDMRSNTVAGNSNNLNISGGVIADLAGNAPSNARSFFSEPSVARVSDDAFGSYIAISIGSGQRADPKDVAIDDKFYMFKDPYVFSPKLDVSGNPNYLYNGSNVIKDDGVSIADITNNNNPDFSDIGEFGWSLDFTVNGEKVLTQALTADFNVFFTTYLPDASVLGSDPDTLCTADPAVGGGRLYSVSLLTGRAITKSNGNDLSGGVADPSTLTSDDRFTDLATPGISAAPQLIITDSSTTTPPPPTAADTDGDGIFDVVDVDQTGGVDLDGNGIDDAQEAMDTDGDGIIDAFDVDQTGGTDADNDGVDDIFQSAPTPPGTCASTTTVTLLVGLSAFIPPICTAPVRTYWNRF